MIYVYTLSPNFEVKNFISFPFPYGETNIWALSFETIKDNRMHGISTGNERDSAYSKETENFPETMQFCLFCGSFCYQEEKE